MKNWDEMGWDEKFVASVSTMFVLAAIIAASYGVMTGTVSLFNPCNGLILLVVAVAGAKFLFGSRH